VPALSDDEQHYTQPWYPPGLVLTHHLELWLRIDLIGPNCCWLIHATHQSSLRRDRFHWGAFVNPNFKPDLLGRLTIMYSFSMYPRRVGVSCLHNGLIIFSLSNIFQRDISVSAYCVADTNSIPSYQGNSGLSRLGIR
jgi:hypothetical protein